MWMWIIIIAGVIGAIIAFYNSGKIKDALEGALTGGCFAGSCLFQILNSAIVIFIIIWLFEKIFIKCLYPQ